MFRTHALVGKSTSNHQLFLLLSSLLVVAIFLAAVLFSLISREQAHAVGEKAPGNQTAAIAMGQIGGHCDQYYGCPYPGEWCAEFAMWVWSHGGASTVGLTAGAGSFYLYGLQHHTLSNTPKVGDAIVYGNDGQGYAEHVAIVVSVDPSNHTIRSIGGNEGDAGVVQEDGPYNWRVGGDPTGQVISGYVAPVGGGTPPLPVCPAMIEYGSTGSLVVGLQSELNSNYAKKGFSNKPYNFYPPLAVDGVFGPKTEHAVKDFQTAKNIGVDGIVGPQTWHALGRC